MPPGRSSAPEKDAPLIAPIIERLPANAADPSSPSLAYQACVEIRRVVFILGQSVPAELEFDGLDQDAVHFLALDAARKVSRALGTARLRTVNRTAKAERFAVLEEARGRGIGRALVEAIEAAARQEGLRSIKLNAQVQAADFYAKLGFVPSGDPFVEAGIDHCPMTKRLL